MATDIRPDGEPPDALLDEGESEQPEPPPFPACGLVTNGNAELGTLSGWSLEEGDFRVVGEDPERFPPPFQGEWFFFAGTAATSQMSQTIDVTDWSGSIDRSELWFRFSGQVRDWSGTDHVSLGLEFLDTDGESLESRVAGPYDHSYWRERQVASLVPPGTRRVRIAARSERLSGTDNDGYLDALDGCLDTEEPPELDGFTLEPHLMWGTTNAVSVLWETLEPSVGRVEFGTGTLLDGSSSESSPGTFHEVRLEGLEPDREYRYRVGSPDHFGPTRRFRTSTAGSGPISFVVWGDNQNGPNTFQGLVREMVALQPDFALSVGDVVQSGTVENYHDQLWGPANPLVREVPLLIAPGNHERYEDPQAALFDAYVSQPGDEHCFGWTYGPLFFLFADTDREIYPGSPEYSCIVAALGSDQFAASSLQIALFHKPPRIEYWDGTCDTGDISVRYFLEPLFQRQGVDLVLNGHAHLYSYTPPVDGIGPAWVTTGGGGGEIDGPEDYCYTWDEITVTHHEHHFLHATYQDNLLTVQAVGSDGTILDVFSLAGD